MVQLFLFTACNNDGSDNREYEIFIEGSLEYYQDTLFWIGGESDPSGFILSDYSWIYGEPQFSYYRIYVDGKIDSTYLNNVIEIGGQLETISAGGIETPLRKFPFIIAESTRVKPITGP